MPFYRFKLLSASGRIDRGVVDLPFNENSPAIRYLERQGGVIIDIHRLGLIMSWLTKFVTQGFSRVKRPDLSEFFNNMAMLLGAGVPVLSSMNEIMQEIKNPMLEMTLKFMRTDIESGQTFGEALARHPKVFNPLIQYMCRIGEETGMLDKMCERSANHLENIEKIVSGTKRALIYPAFILMVVICACAFWFLIVVPKILDLFIDMKVAIPWPTQLLMNISNWFQAYFGWTILAGVATVFIIGYVRRKNTWFHYRTDWILLHLPVFNNIIHLSTNARVSEYLGILIAAGVGVVRTLEIITDSIENLVYKGRLILVQEAVKNGNPLSDSLRGAEALHPFAIRMVSVGEQTGRIEEQTEYVAKIYRDKLDGMVEILGKTLEPLMLVIMGVMFGAIFAGLMLPIYDMMGKL